MNTAALRDRKAWYIGGGVAAILMVAACWFLLISPKMSDTSDLESQAQSIDTQNMTATANNTKLARQSSDYAQYRSQLVAAIRSLPADSGLPRFTDEVSALAAAHSLRLKSMTISSPAAVSTTSSTPSTDDQSSGGTTSSAATTSGNATSSSGQFSIGVNIVTSGSLSQQAAFVKALSTGERRVLVTSTQLSAGGASSGKGAVTSVDRDSTMTTAATVFAAPMTLQQVAQINKLIAADH